MYASELYLELKKIADKPADYESRQQGKKFFRSEEVSSLLVSFLTSRGLTKSALASEIGVSTASLNRILSGADLSENMLFRMIIWAERAVRLEDAGEPTSAGLSIISDSYRGKWRSIDDNDLVDSISELTRLLLEIQNKITASNALGREGNPISQNYKSMVISVLESTIAQLKAPALDIEKTKETSRWLEQSVRKKAKEAGEEEIASAIEFAISLLKNIVKRLGDRIGSSDLGNWF